MKKLHFHLKGILKGSYAMMHLKDHWCDHIGNTRATFLWALLINLVAVPLSVYMGPSTGDPMQSLPATDQLLLEGLMIPIVLLTVLLLTVAHRRHKKFSLIYA